MGSPRLKNKKQKKNKEKKKKGWVVVKEGFVSSFVLFVALTRYMEVHKTETGGRRRGRSFTDNEMPRCLVFSALFPNFFVCTLF